jgi:hypothetical protein
MLTNARPRESGPSLPCFHGTAKQIILAHAFPAVDYFHLPQPRLDHSDHLVHPLTTRPAQISDRNSPSQRALPALTARSFHPAIVTLILV